MTPLEKLKELQTETPFDLIHADPGVNLNWNAITEILTVSGSGRCVFGDVRGGLVAKGSVEVRAQTVEGNTESWGTTILAVQTVEGNAWGLHESTFTAHKRVVGEKFSLDQSTLTVGGERIEPESEAEGVNEINAKAVSFVIQILPPQTRSFRGGIGGVGD